MNRVLVAHNGRLTAGRVLEKKEIDSTILIRLIRDGLEPGSDQVAVELSTGEYIWMEKNKIRKYEW